MLNKPQSRLSDERTERVISARVQNEFHILNLGAGVQSTTLYLMSIRGEAPRFDCAIFADTQEEPQAVYAHLEWLKSLNGPPIIVRSAGKLGDDLIQGRNTTGGRSAAIPAFTREESRESEVLDAKGNPVMVRKNADELASTEVGRTKRQCSKEYKTEVIESAIRRDVLGLKPRRTVPKGVTIHQYFGISIDEAGRSVRIRERFKDKRAYVPHFPFVESMTGRANCKEKLIQIGVPHEVPRSACVFCPFHTDAEWQRLKESGNGDWTRAVEVDAALRTTGAVANRDMRQTMYVHRSCKPLDQVEFHPRQSGRDMQLGFAIECEGVCGV